MSQYALSLIRDYQQLKEGERIEDMKWVRRDGRWVRGIPEVGDHVWFIGDNDKPELQGRLIIREIREATGQIIVHPVDNREGTRWVVYWKDISYTEPEEATDQYLYGIIE